MKKTRFHIIILLFPFLLQSQLNAQVMSVPEIIQEQSNWCWAASSASILDYFQYPQAQCTIAEYTRTVATWHNFGTVNCCSDPDQGCNYANQIFGINGGGSIQDILNHFGNIQCLEINTYFTPEEIQTEITNGHPFILRWAWVYGGGHFLVGYGISGYDIYYMDPGYGYEIADYNWLINDGDHNWSSTLKILSSCPPPIQPVISGNMSFCQNTQMVYSVVPDSTATGYIWTLPAGWSGTSTSGSIMATTGSTGGSISVTALNSCGSSLPMTVTLYNDSVPAQPGVITGNSNVCKYSSQTYSINPVPGAVDYTWNLPPGWSGSSSTISVTTIAGLSGGNITVSADNACGSSLTQSILVNVDTIPSQPGPINGNNNICRNSTQTYFIDSVAGAVGYIWSLPQGWSGYSITDSITVTAGNNGGTIHVSAVNNCETSQEQLLDVAIDHIQTSVTINGTTLFANASPASYQWLICPTLEIIYGQVYQTYTPVLNGSYAVIVTQNDCSDTSICYPMTVQNINDAGNPDNIYVFPNPSSDFLFIKSEGSHDVKYSILLTNSFGQVILKEEYSRINSLALTKLDIEKLQPGLYFLHVQADDVSQVFKVLKQ
ncbi:MAG: T9SS type A sorting domain-containing protein [Bacteroidia bacterium]|nr:T9SS type A sorting domain-containing protein [Bacteroidia bacterium]